MITNTSIHHFENLNINTEIIQLKWAKEMAGHLRNDPTAQAEDSFSQQTLDITSCILHNMKDVFDTPTNTVKPGI